MGQLDIKIGGEVGQGISLYCLGCGRKGGGGAVGAVRFKLRELGETGGAVRAESLGNELAWGAQRAEELGTVEVR